jgi:hypothetical protein
MMPYANLMSILYRKGILNGADPVSRRPDIHPVELRRPDELLSLWWDGNVSEIVYNYNDPALMTLLP